MQSNNEPQSNNASNKSVSFKRLQPMLPFLALPLLAVSALGQTTGVSNPDQANDISSAPAQTDHYVKPSHTAAASPADSPAAAQSYPATAPEVSYPATGPAPTADAAPQPTAALIVRQPEPTPAAPANYAPVQTASVQLQPRTPVDDDSGVVMAVPVGPHELGAGTVLKTHLRETFSTETTPVGARFSADLLADAGHSGEVLLPAGSIIHGRVAAVHGGKRISGPASIRLQPETVTLPDGTLYSLRATVSGLDGMEDARVSDEGAIQAKGHPKQDAAALGLTTATAAVTGAVIGGGVGAIVGASIGAGVGTVVWLRQDHQETLPEGTALYFSLDEPLQLNPR